MKNRNSRIREPDDGFEKNDKLLEEIRKFLDKADQNFIESLSYVIKDGCLKRYDQLSRLKDGIPGFWFVDYLKIPGISPRNYYSFWNLFHKNGMLHRIFDKLFLENILLMINHIDKQEPKIIKIDFENKLTERMDDFGNKMAEVIDLSKVRARREKRV